MGRHRRSGAAPAAEDYAAGSDRRHRGARRKRGAVRTGLLGASAAVAVGAVAVASGLLPGGETLTVGSAGSGEQQTESRQAPELTTQGGSSATPSNQSSSPAASAGTGKGAGKASTSPSATPSPKPSKTTASPTPKKPAPQPTKTAPKTTVPTTKPKPKPVPTTVKPVVPTQTAPVPTDRAAAAEAEVVRLVNQERAKVGCSAVRSDGSLAALAGAFSKDMAARGFFDHTDPDGDTPWERARQAGISGLGGENIARGQVDAAAVMESWMTSDGHRANILNCDYTTLGVGVHFADGGPWWTQDFGF
ncbi:CAP domain-containing protein [Streptomyces sp. NPDC059875]|uniref:CAP domain-containing protein n=1 Tax=unclassified Streptomyces TaxID=2593676 RepID=UPI00365FD31C